MLLLFFFFFFQAEDGIRDRDVTGVQTCALPIAIWGGEPGGPEAVAHARQAVEIAEAIGDSFSRVVASAWLGLAHVTAGDAPEAQAVLGHTLEMIEKRGAGREFEPSVHSGLATALQDQGELDRAAEQGELAVDLAEKRGVATLSPSVRLNLAEILIERDASGDLARASSLLDEAERLGHEMKQRPHVAMALATRARLLDRLGDSEGRDAARDKALALAREMDARGILADLEAEAASAT